MWDKAKPPLLWADNETVATQWLLIVCRLFLFKIKRSFDNWHKNGIGAYFSQFLLGVSVCNSLTRKPPSVYGGVGLKCPEIGKNRA